MSSVAEIEMAIEKLPPADQKRLRDWLLRRSQPSEITPKTGAELAAIWPTLFHLTSEEADDLARDLDADRRNQNPPQAPEWE
jgi:hypothetical protein